MTTETSIRQSSSQFALSGPSEKFVVSINYGNRWHETKMEGTELQAIETARAVYARSGFQVAVKTGDHEPIATFGPAKPKPLPDSLTNRRALERTTFRSRVTGFVLGDESEQTPPKLVSGWTVDVSRNGAAVVLNEPIDGPRLAARYLLPWLGTQCFAGDIVNSVALDEFLGQRGTFYRYGIRFSQPMTNEEFDAIAEEEFV